MDEEFRGCSPTSLFSNQFFEGDTDDGLARMSWMLAGADGDVLADIISKVLKHDQMIM